jgi:hypothetical protein
MHGTEELGQLSEFDLSTVSPNPNILKGCPSPCLKPLRQRGQINKTDTLDARELNMLQRNGTLLTVGTPPGASRDQRELPRTRMVLVRQRTQLKNRLHATLAKYAFHDVQRKPHPRQRHEQLNGQRRLKDTLDPVTAFTIRATSTIGGAQGDDERGGAACAAGAANRRLRQQGPPRRALDSAADRLGLRGSRPASCARCLRGSRPASCARSRRADSRAVRLLFATFRRTGSAEQVVRHFAREGILFPRRLTTGPRAGAVVFGPLVHSRVLNLLHNPRYAGAFVYGRTRQRTVVIGWPDGPADSERQRCASSRTFRRC